MLKEGDKIYYIGFKFDKYLEFGSVHNVKEVMNPHSESQVICIKTESSKSWVRAKVCIKEQEVLNFNIKLGKYLKNLGINLN